MRLHRHANKAEHDGLAKASWADLDDSCPDSVDPLFVHDPWADAAAKLVKPHSLCAAYGGGDDCVASGFKLNAGAIEFTPSDSSSLRPHALHHGRSDGSCVVASLQTLVQAQNSTIALLVRRLEDSTQDQDANSMLSTAAKEGILEDLMARVRPLIEWIQADTKELV